MGAGCPSAVTLAPGGTDPVAGMQPADLRLPRRTAGGPRQQVPDLFLQDRIGRLADGVADLLRLQQLVQLEGITSAVT